MTRTQILLPRRHFVLCLCPCTCSSLILGTLDTNEAYILTLHFYQLKPLSYWDATTSRWVCESIRQSDANCRETFAWYRKVPACIANLSRTVRQSFKHVILLCATKIIAKPSPSHRICREPVANPSPTLRRRSQTHRKEVPAIC